MKRTSAELKRIARENLTGHYGLPMGALVVIILITSVLLAPFSLFFQLNQTNANMIIYQIANIIISLISVILYGGLIRIHLKLARKEQPVFSDLFYCFKKRPDRFIISTVLVVVICLICMLPFLLLIFIPDTTILFYVLLIVFFIIAMVAAFIIEFTFALAYFLLVDNEYMTALEALNTSRQLMKGNKGRLFYISLSFIGWAFLALLTCGIGYLWLAPYMSQTGVEFYRDIIGELDKIPDESEYHFYDEGVIADFDSSNTSSEYNDMPF